MSANKSSYQSINSAEEGLPRESDSLVGTRKENSSPDWISKNRKVVVLLAALCFVSIGLFSSGGNSNQKYELASLHNHDNDDVDLATDAPTDEITPGTTDDCGNRFDENGCFTLDFCDSTTWNGFISCVNKVKVLEIDLWDGGNQVGPNNPDLAKYLFGSDVMGSRIDADCEVNGFRNAVSCSVDGEPLMTLTCAEGEFGGECKVCKDEVANPTAAIPDDGVSRN